MLELQKKVLAGISFSKELFKKELKKSVVWLSMEDLANLKKWVKANFGQTHGDVIFEVLH